MLLRIFSISLVPLAVIASLDEPLQATNSHPFDNTSSFLELLGFSRISRGLVKRACSDPGNEVCEGQPDFCCPPGATCCVSNGYFVGTSTLYYFPHLAKTFIKSCVGCCDAGQVIPL